MIGCGSTYQHQKEESTHHGIQASLKPVRDHRFAVLAATRAAAAWSHDAFHVRLARVGLAGRRPLPRLTSRDRDAKTAAPVGLVPP